MEKLLNLAKKYRLYIKFLFAGGFAALTHLTVLYFLTGIVGVHYLISTSVAFIIAYFVSFFLQKFWTFQDNSKKRMYWQMPVYFIVGLTNLGINDLGMYLLVDKVKLHYLISQIIMGAIVAISSFLIYKFVIFKNTD